MRATRVKQDGAMTGPVFMADRSAAHRHSHAAQREDSEEIRETQQLPQLQHIALDSKAVDTTDPGPVHFRARQ